MNLIGPKFYGTLSVGLSNVDWNRFLLEILSLWLRHLLRFLHLLCQNRDA